MRSEVFVGLVLLGQLATTHLSVVALPLPYIIIIPYSVDFVNTFLIFFRVALVRSHFKPVCVLRTICIAGGRSLCGGSVPHFQFTVLLRQLVPSHHRPFPLEVALDRLHSYSAKVRLLHPRFLHYYNTTFVGVCQPPSQRFFLGNLGKCER